MGLAFTISLVVLGTTLVLLLVSVVAAKVVGGRRERAHERLVDEVRPLVLAGLEGDAEPMLGLSGTRAEVAESVATTLLPKLRGADRAELASALERAGAIERARRALHHGRASRRQRAAELLGAAGAASATVDLLAALDDHDAGVRTSAARALGRIGRPGSVPALVAALDDRRVPANTVAMALLRVGPRAAPALVPALQLGAVRTRTIAAELLGSFGHLPAAPTLHALVYDEEPRVRISAVRALGRLGEPSTAPRIAGVLQWLLAQPELPDADLAAACATALGQIGDRRAAPLLRQALGRSHRVSFAAAAALAELGPTVAPEPLVDPADGVETAPVAAILAGRAVGAAS